MNKKTTIFSLILMSTALQTAYAARVRTLYTITEKSIRASKQSQTINSAEQIKAIQSRIEKLESAQHGIDNKITFLGVGVVFQAFLVACISAKTR